MTPRNKAVMMVYIIGGLFTRGYFLEPEQNATNCGTRSTVYPPGNWPFHVALNYALSPYRTYYLCGGTLIGERSVLTAAHCVVGQQVNKPMNGMSLLTVQVGVYELDASRNFTSYNVASIIIHPEYNMNRLTNDVAVLKLAELVLFNQLVQPACLWPVHDSGLKGIVGTVATAIGWGVTENEQFSKILKESTYRLPSMEDCTKFYGEFLMQRNDSIVCARTEVCNGSGGSGLYVQRNDTIYLRGIVSFGPRTGSGNRCGVNTFTGFLNIGKYTEWIEQQMQKEDEQTSVSA